MKILKYIIVFGVLTAFLSSCMMGPKFQKIEVESPQAYLGANITTDSINLKWWEIFDDPVLDTLVVHSLIYNKDVLMAAKRIEQARAYYGMTKADMLPVFDISAGASRGNFLGAGNKMSAADNSFYVTPSLSWELDFWGKYRRLSEAAQADLLASEYGMRSMQISLISDLSTLYFELLDYRKRLEISKITVELRKNSLDIIQMRFDEGIVPEIDVNQAEAQWAVASAAVPSYERAVIQTQYALSVLAGENPRLLVQYTNLEDQALPIEIPTGLPSELLRRRPDIAQAEAQFKSQNAQIGAAIAARFPSISITGLFGAASNDLASLTTGGMAWSAGASLLSPLFNFGKNKRRVEVERYKAEEMILNYENVVLYAFKEVEDALINISSYTDELEAREIHFKATANAAKLSALRYDKGVTSYLEVLENERSAFEAELKLTEINQELLNSYVALYKSLGGGWLNSEEEQAYQAEQAK
ncbi:MULTISPECIES: efflux transporter outer membrane subunit [unclassified Lentimicrobium]|uniref:efflux transporter outer membrane subunit n=1 Tax=unclassified Lentimicrobium TaxID=2677434 RepID=UPI0015543F09|nr:MULTISPECIES: efflux transporter outer membrane subunit [unclassified Lentimicrobium]NPD44741.1 efflux transporter outer membrane subunit [Lentimicrobium sp. S6]NPD83403.1 efflux transporter outer membrane subunit [Lentimicrobium sp. L6]